MIAIVKHVSANGSVTVIVRRGHVHEMLDGQHTDLQDGDRVEVKRVTNNPYLVRVLPDFVTGIEPTFDAPTRV